MAHNYEVSEGGNYYTEYTCRYCQKVVVIDIEDGQTAEELSKADTTVCPDAPKVITERIEVADWMPVRDSLQYAYEKLGLSMVPFGKSGLQYPTPDWNLAAVLYEYNLRNLGNCIICKKGLNFYTVIRCLDCRSQLCKDCAPVHFGPNHEHNARQSHGGKHG